MRSNFDLIPSIDLMDGQVVRLLHGRADQKTVYAKDPVEMARSFEKAGAQRIHVVDLNGAFQGAQANFSTIKAIREHTSARIDVGGGIRGKADMERLLSIGIDYCVLGTKAVEDPAFLRSALADFAEKIIVGVDARDGKVAVRGWVDVSQQDALEFAKELDSLGVKSIIYTDIATDGALTGPNLKAQQKMAQSVQMSVIASGGIRSTEDVLALAFIPCENLIGAIAGKSIYDGRIDLAATFRALRKPH